MGTDVARCLTGKKGYRSDGESETFIAHSPRGQGFDASEDGTGRGTPLVPVHAIQAGALRQNPMSGPDGIGVQQSVAYTLEARVEVQAIQAGSAVRRLTPRECERLQGFPDVLNSAIITICEEEKSEAASSAALSSAAQRLAQSAPVAVHVLIDLERQVLQARNLAGSSWSASIAGDRNSSPLLMPPDAFARLAVPMLSGLAQETTAGKAGSLLSSEHSLPRVHGSIYARLSGRAMLAAASDVTRLTEEASRFTKSTISEAGSSSPTSEQTWATWSCYVAAAISSCIPERILNEPSFALRIDALGGWTQVTYRGKPAADGPRYKAIGNSMAVPVLRWIGRRLDAVERQLSDRRTAP